MSTATELVEVTGELLVVERDVLVVEESVELSSRIIRQLPS